MEAVTTPASVTPAKISLGEGNGGSSNLTVSNTSSAPITYNLSGLTTVGTGPSTAAGAVYPFNFSYLLGSNTATFSSPSVTVPGRWDRLGSCERSRRAPGPTRACTAATSS